MEYRTWPNSDIKTSLLGFGCMRFPTLSDGKIDEQKANEMLEYAYQNGVNYFDNAYMYLDFQDEKFVGKFLKNKPRNSFYVTSKLPIGMINSLEEAKKIFFEQLENLQIDHFDFYLLHCLNKENFKKIKNYEIMPWILEMQKNGKINKLGFSFHDSYDVFEEIVNFHNWDFCQIQYNYIDTNYQAGDKGYELAKSKGIPVVVMEPVRGGQLCNLSDNIAKLFKEYNESASLASWGYRWVASHDNVKVILSGMSNLEQVKDNLNTFNNYSLLNKEEEQIIKKVAQKILASQYNKCTQCAYCQPCPNGVNIPQIFRAWNNYGMFNNKENFIYYYERLSDIEKPTNCIKCGSCENKCPQNMKIREDLIKVYELYIALKGEIDGENNR